MRFNRLLGLLALAFCLNACEADVDLSSISSENAYGPSLLVPVAGLQAGFADLIYANFKDNNVLPQPDGEIAYINSDTVLVPFALPDSTCYSYAAYNSIAFRSEHINTNSAGTPSSVSNRILIPDYGLGERVDSLYKENCKLLLEWKPTAALALTPYSKIDFKLVFPGSVLTTSVQRADTLSFSAAAGTTRISIPVSKGTFYCPSGVQGIPFTLIATARSGATAFNLSANSGITYTLALQKGSYLAAYGDFPVSTTPTLYNYSLNIYNVFKNSLFHFSNPSIDLSVRSNIGEYMNVDILHFRTYPKAHPELSQYAWFDNHSTNATTQQMALRPALRKDSVINTFPTFDKDNGQTNLLFADTVRPDNLEIKFKLSRNNLIARTAPDFLSSDGKIKVHIVTKLTMQFDKGTHYQLVDSMEVSSTQSLKDYIEKNKKYITQASVVLYSTSSLPNNTTVDLLFYDSSGQVLDLAEQSSLTLKGAPVDANGDVIMSQVQPATAYLSVPVVNLSKIADVSKIKFTLGVEGSEIKSGMHFNTRNRIDLKVALFLNTDLSENVQP